MLVYISVCVCVCACTKWNAKYSSEHGEHRDAMYANVIAVDISKMNK